MEEFGAVPIIDVSAITDIDFSDASVHAQPSERLIKCAHRVGEACRRVGFFYVSGYECELSAELERQLDDTSREFFRLPAEEKMRIHMSKGGTAWRGFFPVGEELTSGRPDIKEGLYLGQELPADDPLVRAGYPVHGANLFPDRPAALKPTVLSYISACESLGQKILALIALSLDLPLRHFVDSTCKQPLCLFRTFHYPPPVTLAAAFQDPELWGVGEHTDYGLLTLLKQDEVGGLQVRNRAGAWVAAPPMPGTLVVNIGDMLEAMTQGLYRSTPHRVRNPSPDAMRLSFPFFFDPGYEAIIGPLPLNDTLVEEAAAERRRRAEMGDGRWDGKSPLEVRGTYGEYLLGKISKVFPELAAATIRS
jgi:isopenicillin N synthase-like dioxygenase